MQEDVSGSDDIVTNVTTVITLISTITISINQRHYRQSGSYSKNLKWSIKAGFIKKETAHMHLRHLRLPGGFGLVSSET